MDKALYIAIPIAMLAISSLVQGDGNLMGSAGPPVCLTNQAICVQTGGSTTISCPANGPGINGFNACQVSASCKPLLPPPAYCFFGIQYINPGDTLVVQSTQIAGQGVFNFAAIGLDGVIAMITVAVAVAVLSGITIFGTGLSQESIFILFMAGLLLGLFGFFSFLDGFVTGNPNSFFTQLNGASTSVGIPPIGTITYIVLTVIELLGIAKHISRGGS